MGLSGITIERSFADRSRPEESRGSCVAAALSALEAFTEKSLLFAYPWPSGSIALTPPPVESRYGPGLDNRLQDRKYSHMKAFGGRIPIKFHISTAIVLAMALLLASCSATRPENPEQAARAAESYYLRGEALAEQGRVHEAIDAYHAAIRATPDFARAYYNLGNQYAKLGRFEPAIASYKRAIQKNREMIKAYNNLGLAYTANGEADKAIVVLRRATGIDPAYATAWNSLGLAYDSLGEHSKAILTFKEAIEIDPGYADAYNNLGGAYSNLQLYREAEDAYQRALRSAPNDINAVFNLGQLYAVTGQTAKAEQQLTTLGALDPWKADELRKAIVRGEPIR